MLDAEGEKMYQIKNEIKKVSLTDNKQLFLSRMRIESDKLINQVIQDYSSLFISDTGNKIMVISSKGNLQEYIVNELSNLITHSSIDIVYGYGIGIKAILDRLPETKIGGYFEGVNMLARTIALFVRENDTLLFTEFNQIKEGNTNITAIIESYLRKQRKGNSYVDIEQRILIPGAQTYDVTTGKVVGSFGNTLSIQKHGLSNVILINEILQRLFAKNLHLSDKYMPGKQAIKERRSTNAILMKQDKDISVYTLLMSAIISNSPNSLLMLANQVIGGNKKTMTLIKEKGEMLGIDEQLLLNITGRKLDKEDQPLSLDDLFIVGSVLFDKFPREKGLLSQINYKYNGVIYRVKTNLFNKGIITHGLFFGHANSIAIVLSKNGGKEYITTVLGASDPYERDQLIVKSLQSIDEKNREQVNEVHKSVNTDKDYTINIIGDTYFGEFYTDIRKKRGQEDALQKYGRNYSFDKIRGFLQAGDFTISNFEAAITDEKEHPMRASKPFILYADDQETIPALEKEAIDLVTLANNHLMDCGINGLDLTLDQFEQSNIAAIGAGRTQAEAERPYIKMVNGQRVAIFNGYWYRNPMYFNYDFYAIGDQAGVACLSGTIMQNIQSEKAAYPDGLVIVIAHWGADFKMVSNKQREYAYAMVDAGADMIIGHGAHMMQEIEQYEDKYIVYSIGNGVFNSNGEYNRRHVAPYSFIAQLVQTNGWELRLYPIYSNNLKTFWQTRFLDEVEAAHCAEILRSYGSSILKMMIDKDGRYYFSMEV